MMHARERGRALGRIQSSPPLRRRADWPFLKAATAVGANIVQGMLHTMRAKCALERANPRIERVRRQILVTKFAIWS